MVGADHTVRHVHLRRKQGPCNDPNMCCSEFVWLLTCAVERKSQSSGLFSQGAPRHRTCARAARLCGRAATQGHGVCQRESCVRCLNFCAGLDE